ncbi:MAG: recombinase family protein [Cyanobacteria bacterium P01_F01_bin.150]
MVAFAYLYIDPLLDRGVDNKLPSEFHEWEASLDKVYRDFGARTSLHQLLKDVDALFDPSLEISGPTDPKTPVKVVIQRLRDLGDSLAEVGDRLQQLEQRKIELVVLENRLDNADKLDWHGEFETSEQFELFHHLQTEQRQRNLQRGHAKRRLKLKPPPGKAPYGYRRGKDRYILDRSTAPVVKDFFDNFLLYGSLRRSVRYLAQKYNKKISVSTGKRWLTNPAYRGHLAYKTGDVITQTHAPILTEDEAAQVDRLLRRNSQLPRRSASAARSLAGLVRCAQCQSPMTITRVTQHRPKQGKKQEYLYLRPTCHADVCSLAKHTKNKSCPGLSYEQVLDQTIDQICTTLPQIMATAPLPDVKGLKQRVDAQIQSKLDIIKQLPDLGKNGVLDQNTIDLRTYSLRIEIADLQSSLAQLPPVNFQETVQAVSLRQFWLDLSESERRFYFREFIHHIEIVRSPADLSQWSTKLVLLLEMQHQPPQ